MAAQSRRDIEFDSKAWEEKGHSTRLTGPTNHPNIAALSLEELADFGSQNLATSTFRMLVEFEYRYRDSLELSKQAKAAEEAARAQVEAANAAIRTAEATEKYVRWIVFSVVLMAVGVVIQALAAFLCR